MSKEKEKKVRHFVHYVENSSPRLRSFASERALAKFLYDFESTRSEDDGYWIDFCFSGELTLLSEHYGGGTKK